jgi:hypothetical protein
MAAFNPWARWAEGPVNKANRLFMEWIWLARRASTYKGITAEVSRSIHHSKALSRKKGIFWRKALREGLVFEDEPVSSEDEDTSSSSEEPVALPPPAKRPRRMVKVSTADGAKRCLLEINEDFNALKVRLQCEGYHFPILADNIGGKIYSCPPLEADRTYTLLERPEPWVVKFVFTMNGVREPITFDMLGVTATVRDALAELSARGVAFKDVSGFPCGLYERPAQLRLAVVHAEVTCVCGG